MRASITRSFLLLVGLSLVAAGSLDLSRTDAMSSALANGRASDTSSTFLTFHALATDLLDDSLKVFLAIIVSNFFSGFDRSPRPDPNSAARDKGFGIGTAGVINVSRDIVAAAAID